jgi:methylmalonyl-CoA mutase cobalamin-binding domain/chain
VSSRGRIVIGTVGLDQHEVGAMAVARMLMRHGFEVIYVGRFNTPARLAAVAQQEDADIVGVSVHSWELAAYAPELVEACHEAGAAVAIGGSVLTESDERSLAAAGVDATFGPYAEELTIIARLDELVSRFRRGGGWLSGRAVVITGAARGLGAAYAERLGREGASLVLGDVDGEALAEQVQGDETRAAVPGDIIEPETSERLVRVALERFGRLDGVVCNAGLLRSGPLLKIGPADLDAVFAVHVRGTFLLLQAAARHWRAKAKEGRPVAAAAVTTTSAAGLYGFMGEAVYSAAKAAIAAMTLVTAAELGRYGVTVNAIAPVARTRLTAWMGPGGEDAASDPYAAAHVAPVIAWLLSERAREVTGRVFEAGGDELAIADGWRQVASTRLPRCGTFDDVAATLEQLVADAPPARAVLSADPALLASG